MAWGMKKYMLIGVSAFVLGAGTMAYVSQQAAAQSETGSTDYHMLRLYGDVLEFDRRP